jgi:N-acetylmuramoyl-L-alanine amidase
MNYRCRKLYTSCIRAALLILISHVVWIQSVAADNDPAPKKLYRRILGKKVKTVVIDAGHGGKDPGCHGSFAYEKDICLAIALKLGKFIEDHYDDVKVIYTRKTDVFVELHTRAKIANDNKADLFICIHVNAGSNGSAYGAETYVMGLHKSEANLAVAKRENAAILYEDNYQKEYEGFDLNSDEGNIIFSLYQNKFLEQSILFASKVQHYFKTYAGRHDRGVRQAGFLVLVRTAMPSVLIETGFATHPEEEKFLADEIGQEIMASAIFQAFAEYKKEVEGDLYTGMKKEFKPIALSEYKGYKSTSSTASDANDQKSKETTEKENTENSVQPTGIRFKVQFLSSPRKLSPDDQAFKGISQIEMVEVNGMYRYMTGNETTLDAATALQKSIREKGYSDAFVVAFNGSERISVKEALEILNKKN